MALVKVDQVVRELCILTGEPDYRNYDSILGHVIDAVRELQTHSMPVLKVVDININTTGIFKWPKDCLRPVIVGLNRGKRVCTLSVCNDPDMSSKCTSVSEAEADIDACLQDDEREILGLGDYSGRGRGYDRAGIVTHDKNRRESHIRCKIKKGDRFTLAYTSDGVTEGLEEIPGESVVVIKQYVISAYYQISKPGISANARVLYEREFIKLRSFYRENTVEEWIEAMRV